jgi:hypothetical protein
MIRDLERSPQFEAGVLASISKTNTKTLNGLTHGGIELAIGMIAEDTLERNYRADDLIEALNFSGAVALMTAHAIAMIADDGARSINLLERSKQWAAD